MDKIYTVEDTSMTKILEEIDNFKTDMELFMKKFPNYSYSISIKENSIYNTWKADIKVKKNEH